MILKINFSVNEMPKIIIITGKQGSGKTSILENKIDNETNGVITICENRKLKKYYFKLINTNITLPCCYYEDGMKFNFHNFDKVCEYLDKLDSKKIMIDEIGWLELNKKGFYKALKKILKEKNFENLYLSMRYDIHERLIEKFKIENFTLIDLSKN